jgi:hypothetical protein
MSEASSKKYMMWIEGKEVAGDAEQSVSNPSTTKLTPC